MNVTSLLFIIIASVIQTACTSITGLDPAETLAEAIEDKSLELQQSKKTKLEFDFIPSATKIKKSPSYDGTVILGVFLKNEDHAHTVIEFQRWYRTTYHNRFVWVGRTMEKTKALGDPFRIVLKRSEHGIEWIDIK